MLITSVGSAALLEILSIADLGQCHHLRRSFRTSFIFCSFVPTRRTRKLLSTLNFVQSELRSSTAPGASGNVATEDLVDLFEREGVATGIDLDALVAATTWLEDEVLKRPLPGRVYRARRGAAERARAGGAG